MRISIFLACFLVLWLLAYTGVLPITGSSGAVFVLLLAAVISAPLSYVLLSKQRDAMSEQVVGGIRTARKKFDASASAEDSVDEEAAARG
ncbi:hypothetical protein BIV57_02670 [Mangrovactinospora gilvigrisea]|uniref:DUF4229 domain-containing protein n=2 Tax=Mangrovactinospora gilvigrisea TaxID=1428644 RepID=A0A1J7CC19_9ACTN|nr:hypothetical protein BIV57_02670 [Mangrovactinospora gilvigrisea]